MSDDERQLMADTAHELDLAAARMIEAGAPWPAYRHILAFADSLMNEVLA